MPRPELRPRTAGLRLMNFALGALLVFIAVHLVILVISFTSLKRGSFGLSEMVLTTKLMLLFPILMALLIAGQFHAYLGTPQVFGKMATPLQMRRDKTLRELPTLPPLPTWKVVLIYLLPLLAGSTFSGLMLRDFSSKTTFYSQWQDKYSQTRKMQWSTAIMGLTQVSCQDFPITSKTAESICFIQREQRPYQSFEGLLQALVFRMQSWLEWRDYKSGPIRHQPDALPTLNVWKGGGFLGGSQAFELRVPSEPLKDDVLMPFQLDYLSRDGSKANALPSDFQQQANWLAKQPFHSYLMVTPLKK